MCRQTPSNRQKGPNPSSDYRWVFAAHTGHAYICASGIGWSIMLVVHATFPIDPDQREEAVDHMKTLAEQSREEDGIIGYRVAADVDDENLFRFFEQYDDEAAFGAHAESKHFAEFAEVLPELLAGEPEVTRFDVEAATDVEL